MTGSNTSTRLVALEERKKSDATLNPTTKAMIQSLRRSLLNRKKATIKPSATHMASPNESSGHATNGPVPRIPWGIVGVISRACIDHADVNTESLGQNANNAAAQPTSTSRPTRGSRHSPAKSRLHEIRLS